MGKFSRRDWTVDGPNVTTGTNWPSKTSTCIQSAEAARAIEVAEMRLAWSGAAKSDGAILKSALVVFVASPPVVVVFLLFAGAAFSSIASFSSFSSFSSSSLSVLHNPYSFEYVLEYTFSYSAALFTFGKIVSKRFTMRPHASSAVL